MIGPTLEARRNVTVITWPRQTFFFFFLTSPNFWKIIYIWMATLKNCNIHLSKNKQPGIYVEQLFLISPYLSRGAWRAIGPRLSKAPPTRWTRMWITLNQMNQKIRKNIRVCSQNKPNTRVWRMREADIVSGDVKSTERVSKTCKKQHKRGLFTVIDSSASADTHTHTSYSVCASQINFSYVCYTCLITHAGILFL